MRKWKKNILLILTSLIFTFLIVEIFARNMFQLPSPYSLQDGRLVLDQRGFWINLPNSKDVFSNIVDFDNANLQINGNGLRNVPCRKNLKNENIFIVGDSQTFGWGLSDQNSWPNLLQCKLNRENKNYNVINMGVPATNIDQYVKRTRMFYNILEKEDIVIFVITWNDFHTINNEIPSIDEVNPCYKKQKEPVEYRRPVFCQQTNITYLGEKNSWRKQLYKSSGIFIPSFSSLREFFDTLIYSSAVANKLVPLIKGVYIRYRNRNTLTQIHPNAFKSNNRTILFLNNVIKRKTKNVFFAFVPNRISYVDELYKLYSQNGNVFPEQDFLFYFASEQCKKNGVNCVSLFETLRTLTIGNHDFTHDGHLNESGAKLVADTLWKYLEINYFNVQ